jgi:hypothetical protein
LAENVDEQLTNDEDERLYDDIGDEACRTTAQGFVLIPASYLLAKLGDPVARAQPESLQPSIPFPSELRPTRERPRRTRIVGLLRQPPALQLTRHQSVSRPL